MCQLLTPEFVSRVIFILFGLGVYLVYFWQEFEVSPSREDKTPTQDIGLALEEYRALVKEVIRRGELVPLTGAILVVGTILLFGYAVSIESLGRFLILLSALVLYTVWLFSVSLSTRKFDEVSYARIRGIEKKYNFQAYCYLKEKIEEKHKIFKRLRHLTWANAFLVLTIIGTVLLFLP